MIAENTMQLLLFYSAILGVLMIFLAFLNLLLRAAKEDEKSQKETTKK